MQQMKEGRGGGAARETNHLRERRVSLGIAALFAALAALTAIDLAGDLGRGLEVQHAVTEGMVVALGLAGASWMLLRLRRLAAEARDLGERADVLAADLDASRADLVATLAEAERWKTEAGDLIAGLGAAIDRQLERWGLSPAEQEVALLLLKGLSHKEVADIRGTGEATVRQQAGGIYRKAGLSGRHDLAAFFLEDLLGPRDEHEG